MALDFIARPLDIQGECTRVHTSARVFMHAEVKQKKQKRIANVIIGFDIDAVSSLHQNIVILILSSMFDIVKERNNTIARVNEEKQTSYKNIFIFSLEYQGSTVLRLIFSCVYNMVTLTMMIAR